MKLAVIFAARRCAKGYRTIITINNFYLSTIWSLKFYSEKEYLQVEKVTVFAGMYVPANSQGQTPKYSETQELPLSLQASMSLLDV